MSTREVISSSFFPMNGSKNVPPVTKIVSVPTINFVQLSGHSIERSIEVQNIGEACKKFGYFQVINHGIQESVINGALEAASDFFMLPTEEKARFESDDIKKPVRYFKESYGRNNNTRALLKHYAYPLGDWIELWPKAPRDYREKMGRYSLEVRRVALQLIDAILDSLGLGQGYLRNKLDDGNQMVVVNCYPKHSNSDPLIGLAPHSDYACITVLVENCKGLHILDKDTGSWEEITGDKNILHVHIGDLIEVLSNGRYKTVIHKAILSNHERISIASLHGFPMNEKVATPRELMNEQLSRRYKESSFCEFLDYLSDKSTNRRKSFMENLRLNDS